MRNISSGFIGALVFCMAAAVAWGLGADHGPGPVGPNDGGWPEEFRGIFNRKDRVHGYFVNSGDVFFYAGDTKAFNGFLQQCSRLKDTDFELTLHSGQAKVRSPWDKQDRDIKADWRLYADRRRTTPGKKYIVQVDVWIGGKVSLDELKVPLDFPVKSDGEFEEFVEEHREKRIEAGKELGELKEVKMKE